MVNSFTGICLLMSLINRAWWFTLSNALERSKAQIFTVLPELTKWSTMLRQEYIARVHSIPFLFDAEYLRNVTRYKHSFNGIIGTYTHPTQRYHFEWPWVTLSDLAKYSVRRSVARSVCNSWASCMQGHEMTDQLCVRPHNNKVKPTFSHDV